MQFEELMTKMKELRSLATRRDASDEDKLIFIKRMGYAISACGGTAKARLGGAAAQHPAIVNCAIAYSSAYLQGIINEEIYFGNCADADAAWMAAVPPLADQNSISDYIACIAYSIGTGICSPERGTRLLYAAQIFRSTLATAERRSPGRPARTPAIDAAPEALPANDELDNKTLSSC